MKKYVITDPCYILPDDVWDKCCEVFNEYENDEFMYQRFNEAVTMELRKFSGDNNAYAGETGYGDWSNEIHGDNVIHGKFGADAGMVCVCKFTKPVEEALNEYDEHCFALFEMEDDPMITFDCSDKWWTRITVTDKKGNAVYSMDNLPGYEDEDEAYDDEDKEYW